MPSREGLLILAAAVCESVDLAIMLDCSCSSPAVYLSLVIRHSPISIATRQLSMCRRICGSEKQELRLNTSPNSQLYIAYYHHLLVLIHTRYHSPSLPKRYESARQFR